MNRETLPARDLAEELPRLLPLAVDWARAEETKGLAEGRPLAQWQAVDAKNVGVRHVDRVRLCVVESMPVPRDPRLAAAAELAGLFLANAKGLTLGYAVFIRDRHAGDRRLLRHELRHVAQHEAAGSMDAFLAKYLDQVIRHGYEKAPLEVDARDHEAQRTQGQSN